MSNEEYEDCLRRVTLEGLNRDDFTLNQARAAAEEELGLEAGFFKNDPVWKAKSKEVVSATVEEPPARTKSAAKAGTKRKSDEAPAKKQAPRKKARKSVSEDELSEQDLGDDESEAQATPSDDDDDFSDAKPTKKVPGKRKPVTKKAKVASDEEADAKPKKKAPVKYKAVKKAVEKVIEDSEASDLDEKDISPAPVVESTEKSENSVKSEDRDVKDGSILSDPPTEDKPDTNGKPPAAEDDESDMSVLIDEPPKKQRGKKPAAESKTKAKTAKPVKKKAAGEALTPDEEEIKRLQGWLVKCGIRKLWHKELAKYDSPKPKIKHLKNMLEEAGMSGRYSNEKAKEIKEKRELAAELEATQEYAKKWGQDKDAGSGDDSGEGGEVSEEELKPATRKPKGLVDFGDSGDSGSD